MLIEEWRPVEGYEDIYEVSNLGWVRSYKRRKKLKPSYASVYPHLTLSDNSVKKTIRVHRIVCIAWHERIPGKNHVNHKDGIKSNFAASNLEWTDQPENNKHSREVLGNIAPFILKPDVKGFKNKCSKIKDIDTVAEIIRLNNSGVSSEQIGPMFNVHGSTIRKHIRKFNSGFHQLNN